MATPTGPEKRLLAVGARRAATWGTAVALGATYGLQTKTLTGFNRQQEYIAAQNADTPLPRTSSLDVVKPVDFTHGVEMLYDPGILGTLVALLMGTAGAPTQQGATTAYLHKLQLADTSWGRFATFAAEYPGKIWECASAKPTEWSLKAAERGFMTSELKFRGNTIIDNSSVNTDTQMDALTYADRENRVLFRHNAVRMNAQTGGNVDSETALNVNGIEINIKRTGHDEPRGANATTIVEPAEAGWPDIRVKLSFPRFDAVNAAFFQTAIAETYQKMTIAFVSPALAGTGYPYTLKFWFPRLRLLCPDASWEDLVKMGIELVAEEASANPTGMEHVRPYITLINRQTTDYLA